jgi:hypothetical protein
VKEYSYNDHLRNGKSFEKKRKHIIWPPKLPAICDLVLQCSKCNKVAPQTTKMYQKYHFFLYSYNTPNILTNIIIK